MERELIMETFCTRLVGARYSDCLAEVSHIHFSEFLWVSVDPRAAYHVGSN